MFSLIGRIVLLFLIERSRFISGEIIKFKSQCKCLIHRKRTQDFGSVGGPKKNEKSEIRGINKTFK